VVNGSRHRCEHTLGQRTCSGIHVVLPVPCPQATTPGCRRCCLWRS